MVAPEEAAAFLRRHFAGMPDPWWAAPLLYEALLVGAWALEARSLRAIRAATGDPTEAARADRRYNGLWLVQFLLLQLPLTRAGRWWTPFPEGWLVPLLGAALACAGEAIRLRALRHLGANFSYVVRVGARHSLVTDGPYARVRHPLYAGLLVYFAGVPLVVREFWSWFVVMGWVGVSVAIRIRREERALEARFGDAFRAWKARTSLLVPRRRRP
jgi:protein-S-isoprenylcysteine O-methyltransferase Ste14